MGEKGGVCAGGREERIVGVCVCEDGMGVCMSVRARECVCLCAHRSPCMCAFQHPYVSINIHDILAASNQETPIHGEANLVHAIDSPAGLTSRTS